MVVVAVEVVSDGLNACFVHVVVNVAKFVCALRGPGASVFWVEFVGKIGGFFAESVDDLQ